MSMPGAAQGVRHLEMGQDGVVDVQQTLSLGDPDSHRSERLGNREGVTADVGDPMMFDRRPALGVHVDTLDSEVPFAYGLDCRHELRRSG